MHFLLKCVSHGSSKSIEFLVMQLCCFYRRGFSSHQYTDPYPYQTNRISHILMLTFKQKSDISNLAAVLLRRPGGLFKISSLVDHDQYNTIQIRFISMKQLVWLLRVWGYNRRVKINDFNHQKSFLLQSFLPCWANFSSFAKRQK